MAAARAHRRAARGPRPAGRVGGILGAKHLPRWTRTRKPGPGRLRSRGRRRARACCAACSTACAARRRPRDRSGDPRRLGRYRILHRLGQGGMGVVFAAEDESLGRRVAVKTIAEPDDSARKRFRREARAAAAVNHPNVCQVYEIGEDGGQLFIAMELLEGEPLVDRLAPRPAPGGGGARAGPIHARGARRRCTRRGVVHRDLKPSNVFLTPHGVKLLDFGLARPLPQGADAVARGAARSSRAPGCSWARRATWRPSRCSATRWTRAPTSSPPRRSSTRRSRAAPRSWERPSWRCSRPPSTSSRRRSRETARSWPSTACCAAPSRRARADRPASRRRDGGGDRARSWPTADVLGQRPWRGR